MNPKRGTLSVLITSLFFIQKYVSILQSFQAERIEKDDLKTVM